MRLAIDIGSSSVKAAMLDGVDIVGKTARAPYQTDHGEGRSEVPIERIEAAIKLAVGELDTSAATDIGFTGMGPAWLAMDEKGRALTPVVTHADRRSLDEARSIEETVGRERHLALAGNRPTPGGISSTTAAWFVRHTDVAQTASIFGHLPTYLLRKLTGCWTIDPSNAGFTGLMDVSTMDWSPELCDAAGVGIEKLPPIEDAGRSPGRSLENDLNFPVGLPVLGGQVDGSGAILLAGAAPGVLIHSAGTTDVLALCTPRPLPREGLLCRPLGTKGLWVCAATLASSGSAISWLRGLLFDALSDEDFEETCRRVMDGSGGGVRFDPRLSGDRQSVEQPTGALSGLTLATGKEELLRAVLDALATDAAERMNRLEGLGVPIADEIVVTGGLDFLTGLLHRDFPTKRAQRMLESAALRGIGALTPQADA